jgi:AbrB family looped-hinge helix DNA binding protein
MPSRSPRSTARVAIERYTVVTRKGQITLPIELRRALGLKQGDRVAVSLDADGLRLRRAESVVDATAGMFKTDRPARSAMELREAFEIGVAEEVMESMNR